jgi:CheY-like chemotaxis protein
VEQFYKKVDNIDDKVKEANMPYMQWKVLFLVGENTNAEEISSLLEEDLSTVQEILTSLNSKALIEKIDETKTEAKIEEQSEEEASPSIGDELLEEEEEVISQVDEQLEATASDLVEEIPGKEEEVSPETEEVIPELQDDFSLEPEKKMEEETISLGESSSDEETTDDSTTEEDTTIPDITLPAEPEITEQPSEAESLTLPEDEFDLSIDEPETAVADEPEPEVSIEESAEQMSDETEGSDEEIISDSTKKKVMIIDDSIVIRKMIEIALEEEDFNIVTAISGKEGLETIEKEKPNLVILGVDDFLPKPFRDEELVEKVKTLIEV